jgi:F0F1-type ATP synthase epsilon subunit
MRAILSNFLGLRNTGMPLLNSPIKDDKITFIIDQTTENSAIKAKGIIDVTNNNLTLIAKSPEHDQLLQIQDDHRRDLFLHGEQFFAQQAFESLSPHT